MSRPGSRRVRILSISQNSSIEISLPTAINNSLCGEVLKFILQSVLFRIEAGNLADLNYIASLNVRMLSKEVECQNGRKRKEPESWYRV